MMINDFNKFQQLHETIKKLEIIKIISKVEPLIEKCNWEGINYPLG